MFKSCHVIAIVVAGAALAAAANGQWNPAAGDWGKSDATDLRVMTWNVRDGIRSDISKQESNNAWTALVVTVAAFQPDFLILQECGDGANGADSVDDLETAFDLFLHGGTDPFLGGTVTAYVQKYAPAFDLPYIFVSGESDNYNRNVICSRYPFVDLNGDGRALRNDIPGVSAHLYAPGGDGGIRGFQFAEIDLDDATYAGDLVLGNAHLKAGGGSSDKADRLEASQNVAYVIDYWYNGGGSGLPDPYDKISDIRPVADSILDENTPVVIGGDWNEDELYNSRRGPAAWLTEAEDSDPGSDGTDRDRSDMSYDDAREYFTSDRATFNSSSSKYDYVAWQDSIATLRRAWVFRSYDTPTASLPPELSNFPYPTSTSGYASDHLCVVADFVLPLSEVCEGDLDGNQQVGLADLQILLSNYGSTGAAPTDGDLDGDTDVDLADLQILLSAYGTIC